MLPIDTSLKPNTVFDLKINITQFVIFIAVVSAFTLQLMPISLVGIQILIALILFMIFIRSPKVINDNIYLRINGIFLSWCALSLIWSLSYTDWESSFQVTFRIVVLCSLISCYLTDTNKINKMIYIIAVAGIVMLIVLAIITPITDWKFALKDMTNIAEDEGRIGYSIGFHPNALGNTCMSLILLWIYLCDYKKSKLSNIVIIPLIIVLLFTKSRMSFILLILGITIYVLLRKKRRFSKKILVFACTLIFAYLIYWSLFNIPVFYKLIGFRMEGLFSLSNNKIDDASVMGRWTLISYGFDMFIRNPIFGVGYGNFGYNAYSFYGLWKNTYSHSNYIEMLANLGIVGFSIYYVPLIWTCITLFRTLKRKSNEERRLYALLFTLIFVRLIGDLQQISYDSTIDQFLNMACFCAALLYMKSSNRNKKRRPAMKSQP